jgi:alpha-glucosidase
VVNATTPARAGVCASTALVVARAAKPTVFLDHGRSYLAEIYADASDADWEDNPQALDLSQATVDADTTLSLVLAPGGGQAIRIYPAG